MKQRKDTIKGFSDNVLGAEPLRLRRRPRTPAINPNIVKGADIPRILFEADQRRNRKGGLLW